MNESTQLILPGRLVVDLLVLVCIESVDEILRVDLLHLVREVECFERRMRLRVHRRWDRAARRAQVDPNEAA